MRLPIEAYAQIRNIRRLFRGPGTMQTTAYETEILCPEENSDLSPAIFIPSQIEKIVGTPSESTVANEIEYVTRSKAIHAATIAYHIRNAVLLKGSIYSGNLRHQIMDEPDVRGQPTIYFKTAALASTWCGTKYFGHWLKDDCVQYLLAEKYGQPLAVTNTPFSKHMNLYSGYLNQSWAQTSRARIDHLVAYQDFGQNSLKKHRYAILQSRLELQFSNPGNSSTLVYLKRGHTGQSRLIQNEAEIIEVLDKKGFSFVDVAHDELEHIITSLMHAQIVVSVEGSHMCHCWFPPNANRGVIALEPPDRFTAVQRDWAHCMSAKFGFVVGDKRHNETYFSPSDILRTTDLMMAQSQI